MQGDHGWSGAQRGRYIQLQPSLGQQGGEEKHSSGLATLHTAPAVPQVVAIDLDEGLNGLVSYRMQVGMPRLDFVIDSRSGVVMTTAELDRERIAEYQLRVVASDAGTPTKSSTSTLTIRGERTWCLGGHARCSDHHCPLLLMGSPSQLVPATQPSFVLP